MGDPVTINLRQVARSLGLPVAQVQAVLELLEDGNTVPFITRYRKDRTGGLDEEQVRQIQGRLNTLRLLAERKQTILRSIEAQGKLTEKLARQIHNASTAKRLEDLYLPYKPKKQTLATIARSRGLEPLADEILAAEKGCADLDSRAADFINPDRQVPTAADALLGAGHILAEGFSERADLRQRLRALLQRSGKLVSVQAGGEGKASPEKAEPAKTDTPTARHEGTQESLQAPPSPRTTPEAQKHVDGTPAADSQEVGTEQDQRAEQPEPPRQTELVEQAPAAARPAQAEGEEKPASQAAPAQPDEAASQAEAASPAQSAAPPAPARVPQAAKAQRRLSKKEQKKKKAEEKRQKAFRDYFDYREDLKKIPPHRVLAINRGERAKVLRVRVECDVEAMHAALDEMCVPPDHPHAEFLRGCARDALVRLILPSLEREARRELTDRAETHAVGVFARNLRNLLLQPPIRGRRVLAVDPGYRSGCKLVALDQFGNVLAHEVIYLVGRPDRKEGAKRIVAELVDRFGLSVVTIGNGTACREAEKFFGELIAGELRGKDLAYVIVNEAGASVYSTSRLGREEFPHYDATLRGAISIGRRLQDPLSELVKIDPANIGVGLYQHDVKAKHLRASLDDVVESCVNYVGVDVNTASPALLRYVSGLNQLTARRVYEHRLENGPFRNREQLREVPGFGEATFVQAVGFLKITGGDNPLDATWIHPESYQAAAGVLGKLGCSPEDLTRKEAADHLKAETAKVEVAALAAEIQVGELLLKDILAQLARPGRDPREDLPAPVFKQGVLKLEDLSPDMELTGTVLNVVDFGAFVDIGMHDSGLVHVSQLADRFVRDPHDVVAVGDVVKVWVVEVDKQRRRVSLTMIAPGTRGRSGRPEGKPPAQRSGDRPERPARRERSRPEGTAGTKAPPRRKGSGRDHGKERARDRGKGRGREGGRDRGPGKPRFRPRSPSRPITPITDEMKAGKEPMRSFSDLAQFFQAKDAGPPKSGKKPKPRPGKEKPTQGTSEAPKDESQAGEAGPPGSGTQAPSHVRRGSADPADGAADAPTEQEVPPEVARSGDRATTNGDGVTTSGPQQEPPTGQSPAEQQQEGESDTPKDEAQPSPNGPAETGDQAENPNPEGTTS